MCRPHEKYSFPIGERFIYFTGERYLQRSVDRLLNYINIQGVEIYFTECFPSDKIFEGNEGDKYANHEEFAWDVSCENKNTIIENNSLKGCKEDSKKQKEPDVKHEEFITGTMFKLRKEDISLDYLIENKIVKNVLTDAEEYGLDYFVFCQFEEQVEDGEKDNYITCFCDIHGVFGLFIYSDETPIFINDELLDSVYLGNDNKIYYLTEEENIYTYIQSNNTVRNESNKYPA